MTNAEHLPDLELWQPRLARWGERLRALRLSGPAGVILDVLEPLGPFGAHLLWVMQPALALVVRRDDVDALARLLDAPGGFAWLRDHLLDEQDRSPER